MLVSDFLKHKRIKKQLHKLKQGIKAGTIKETPATKLFITQAEAIIGKRN